MPCTLGAAGIQEHGYLMHLEPCSWVLGIILPVIVHRDYSNHFLKHKGCEQLGKEPF